MKTNLFIAVLLILNLNTFAQTECVWTGSEDNWWSNTNNWLNGIAPADGDNVTIQSGGYDAMLNISTTVGNVTIDTGATFFLESFELTIKGDWINYGTVNEGYSYVIFSGNLHQEIQGNQTFYDVESNNEAGVEILSGTTSLKGILKITNGTFSTNNSLILLSDSEGTGSIGPLTNGNLFGEITMQRYLSTSVSDWRFLSSPIDGATLNDINDDFWTAGFPGSTYPTSTFMSVYFYDETDSGTADNGYAAATSINNDLLPGAGFMAYIDSTSLTGIIDYTGIPNMGTINAPVTFTLTDTVSNSDGWNLVGNPYPSAINWDDTSITKTNIYDAIYIWNPEDGVYASYVDGIGTNGGSSTIAAGQAFYVIAVAASPALEFSENCKTAGPEKFLKASSSSSFLTMTVENSSGSDQTVLRPNADATQLFDGSFDAIKMFSSNWYQPSVYTTDSENSYYSINQFPEEEIEIPIYVNTGISEMHTITFSGNESFNNFPCVFLEDLHTGIFYDMKTTTDITVFINDTTSAPRFILRAGAPLFIEGSDATCYGANNGSIYLAKSSNNLFTVNLYNQYSTLLLSDTSVYQIASLENLSVGIYLIESTDALCGTQIDTVLIEEPELISAQFSVSADTVYLPVESAEIFFTNESSNASYFTWEFDNLGTSGQTSPSFDFGSEGVYNVKLFAWQNADCYKVSEQTITVISTLNIANLETNTPTVHAYQNQLYITGNPSDYIEVRNVTGQLITSTKATNDQTVIDIPVSSGQIVIVTIISGNIAYTKKIFIG